MDDFIDVDELGNIYHNGKRIKPKDNGRGYLVIIIKGKTYRIHRMVAIKYIPNPNNEPVVNHKNGNKYDNRVENLEWVSYKSNTEHALLNGLKISAKQPIAIITKKGTIKHVFTSIKQASNVLNLCYRSLFNAVQNDLPYKGMRFKKCKIELME